MSMTDPIADFLTRIRNGIMAAHETVEIPSSRLNPAKASSACRSVTASYNTRPTSLR